MVNVNVFQSDLFSGWLKGLWKQKQTLFLRAYFSHKLCVNWVSINGKSCSSLLKIQGQTLSESFMHFHKLFPKPLVCFLGGMCSCLTGNLHTGGPVQLPVVITLYFLLPFFPLSWLVLQPTHTDKIVDFPRFSALSQIGQECRCVPDGVGFVHGVKR